MVKQYIKGTKKLDKDTRSYKSSDNSGKTMTEAISSPAEVASGVLSSSSNRRGTKQPVS